MRGAYGSFTPDSIAWRLNLERVLILGGGRALLMQAIHPLALAGFLDHSDYEKDPWARLGRTMEFFGAAIYGTPEQAERAGRLVRAMHHRVRGRTKRQLGPVPAGTPYAAEDPELLLWVHATLVENTVVTYETYVGELTPAEKEDHHQEMKAVGEIFGLPRSVIPETYADLEAYMRAMIDHGVVCVTEEARAIARATVLGPPLPPLVRQAWPLVNFVVAGSLPAPIRRGYGLRWSPLHDAAYATARESIKRVVLPALPAGVRRFPLQLEQEAAPAASSEAA